jgi:hypothetical protein
VTTKYFGLDVGFDSAQPITAAGSTTSKVVELVLTTDTLTRADAVNAVERIRLHLSNCSWPPA